MDAEYACACATLSTAQQSLHFINYFLTISILILLEMTKRFGLLPILQIVPNFET